MSTHERPLIGSVFERTTPRSSSAPTSRLSGTPRAGFPVAQHRSKSAFARVREEVKANDGASRRTKVPVVVSVDKVQPQPAVLPTTPIVDQTPISTDTDALHRQIDQENARVIARMSDDEIELGKRAILEQLGEGAKGLLRRVQEVRRRREAGEKEAQVAAEAKEDAAQEAQSEIRGVVSDAELRRTAGYDHIPLIATPIPRRVSDGLASRPGILRVKSLDNIGRSVPSPLPAMSSTRPSSRTGRKLRFAEVTPDDVHVYESAPISPKRTILALPPLPDTKDDSIISLGTFRNPVPFKKPRQAGDSPVEPPKMRVEKNDEPEEGTPEYIRRRYFPEVPANDPSLAWIDVPSRDTTNGSAPRFDLHGAPIPASLSASLPSHLGLHHHAEGSHAGYTIDDVFLLSRSTVPAQRASMLGILAKIARRLGRQVRHPDDSEKINAFAGQETQLRKRILAAGLAAIDQIGGLGARAVEVVWECLVKWDGMSDLEGVELVLAPDIVSLLQLDYFLPRITDVLSYAALPSESLAQLLDVVHWCAQQSNPIADMITTTPRLVPTILGRFLLTPIPPKDDSVSPNPTALQLLITLASASRASASVLVDPADALLRFITPLPPSSPFPPALSTTLLIYTVRFYTTLSSYGLYSHIATTASQVFTALASYVNPVPLFPRDDSAFRQLWIAWASLVEVWTICATDPHATTPPHEILWSQICAWGWATNVSEFGKVLGHGRPDWAVHVAIWDVEAAWLEGARINSIMGGAQERAEALQILGKTFGPKDGTGFHVVLRALEAVQHDLEQEAPGTMQQGDCVLKAVASSASVLASAIRLWLACLPPSDAASLSAPPFALPFSDLSALSAMLVRHPVWALPSSFGAHLRVYLRPLTRFLVQFHRLSRHIPGTTPQLWFAQSLVFLSRALPGDESEALAMLNSFSLVTPHFAGLDPAEIPQGAYVSILQPFFQYAVRPDKDAYTAPLRPNTESIIRSSTLRLPSPWSLSDSGDGDGGYGVIARTFKAGLPLTCNFLFAPLTHLLRSGTSPVFRCPPDDWTASEVDVVRATLLLAYAARRALVAHGMYTFVHGAADVTFECMRVCMLEHGVGPDGTNTEVFRDGGVERLMTLSLEPFTPRGQPVQAQGVGAVHTLGEAAAPYLGATPFYQFYTDLVALYAAVSFGHRTFAALVVAPLAMQYPVDYRRALWCGGDRDSGVDSGTGTSEVVRSVRVPVEEVICTAGGGDPREYLYPVEQDAGVLSAYVAALVARDGQVDGFLRLVAVHHVACKVWEDLDVVDAGAMGERVEALAQGTKRREEIGARLLRPVLVHGAPDVVRDVVLYRQRPREMGPFVWPPACYQGGEDDEIAGSGARWREGRWACVRRVCGEDDVVARVGILLGTLRTAS